MPHCPCASQAARSTSAPLRQRPPAAALAAWLFSASLATAQPTAVAPGSFERAACVLGKVYMDCNRNGVQDAKELGIPGVRLMLQDGSAITTDSEGQYSLCGLPPRTQVLKVDALSLPRGSRLVSSSSRNAGDANSLFLDPKNAELQGADFIEGSCASSVLEQVKARRARGEVRTVEAENRQGPALKFEGKAPGYGLPPALPANPGAAHSGPAPQPASGP